MAGSAPCQKWTIAPINFQKMKKNYWVSMALCWITSDEVAGKHPKAPWLITRDLVVLCTNFTRSRACKGSVPKTHCVWASLLLQSSLVVCVCLAPSSIKYSRSVKRDRFWSIDRLICLDQSQLTAIKGVRCSVGCSVFGVGVQCHQLVNDVIVMIS